MNLLGFFNLRRISGQLSALVVASIVVLHLVITATFFFHAGDSFDGHPFDPGHGQFVAFARLLGSSPKSDRAALAAQMNSTFPMLDIRLMPPGSPPSGMNTNHSPFDWLRHHLGPRYTVIPVSPPPHERAAVILPDGTMLAMNLLPDRPPRRFWTEPWMITLVFVILSLTLLGLWAARALTSPLSAFAAAAENFSLDGASAPLPERGPEEVRSVARALNRMRERITALIDDRTRMLAAISHDLRTPITRLRLRSEFIDDPAHRTQMLRDLDQMRTMLESVLSFLRNDRRLESMTLIDVASTAQLVVDQFTDTGHHVCYDGPPHAMITARPDDLHRAITNLVENAVRFGPDVLVRLRVADRQVTIDIEDNGPGISDARKAAMLEPFVRGDDARNMDDSSGFGLGLSITRSIVQAHGGRLSLSDRAPHGLIVRMELPGAASQQAKAA